MLISMTTLVYFSELGQLSGIAAILRFPIPDPTENEDDDSSSDEG